MALLRGCCSGGMFHLAAAVLCCVAGSSSAAEDSAGGGGVLRGVIVGGRPGKVKNVSKASVSRALADASDRYTWNHCKCKNGWEATTKEGKNGCKESCCVIDDSAGAWCMVEDPECESAEWGYCKQEKLDTKICQDFPSDWVDGEMDTCGDYDFMNWCTPDGEPGTGWDPAWGKPSDFNNQGHSALSACCTCGGGLNHANKCKDKDWSDKDGDSCQTYAEAVWCTADGRLGAGWHEEWGSVDELTNGGFSAFAACCACGGGDQTRAAPQGAGAVAEAPSTAVTLLGCECKTGWEDVVTGKICIGQCCNPDDDPNGNWCHVVDSKCEESMWGYCRSQVSESEHCMDSPATWTDASGYDCSDYEALSFCLATGGSGADWKSEWGTFDKYFHDGHSARTACCACGGGISRDYLLDFDRSCQDKTGWKDSDGDTCVSYYNLAWCSTVGGFGSGWHEEWGTFADHVSGDTSAPQACCSCGGGSRNDFKAHPEAQGTSRSKPADPAAAAPASEAPEPVRTTWNGCECKKEWTPVHGQSCHNSCCNPDADVLGNWCVVKDPACEMSDWGYCMPVGGNTEHDHGSCKDIAGWQDVEGDGCSAYENFHYCNADGTQGEGWDSTWPILSDFRNDGHSATTACCVCGGGNRLGGSFDQEDDEAKQCEDVPKWKDPDGDDCLAYEHSRWCDLTGGFGIGWHEEWGSFRGVTTALKACCYCGGGSTSGFSWNEMVAATKKANAARAERMKLPPFKKHKASFGGAGVAVVLAVLGLATAAGIGGYVLYKKYKQEAAEDDGSGPHTIGRKYDAGDF